jgi:hypothetical protein
MSDQKINGGLTGRVPNINARAQVTREKAPGARGPEAPGQNAKTQTHLADTHAKASRPTSPGRPEHPNHPEKTRPAKDDRKAHAQKHTEPLKDARLRELELHGERAFREINRGRREQTQKPQTRPPDERRTGGDDERAHGRRGGDGGAKVQDAPGRPRNSYAPHGRADESRGRGRDLLTREGGPRDSSGPGRSLLGHLRGEGRASRDTPPGLAELARGVGRAVGRDALRGLEGPRAERLERLFDRLLGSAGRAPDIVGRGHSPKHAAQETVRELASAVHLFKHFGRLEKVGGDVVRRAEAKAFEFLGRQAANPGRGASRVSPSELLRDLRAGAFLPAREVRTPFPSTGRARVVGEMTELVRTLDAIEAALGRPDASAPQGEAAGRGTADVGGLLGGTGLAALAEAAAELLAELPTLPGRAARVAIEQFIASLDGHVVDAGGRRLAAEDGTPLKFDRLLWLGATGGLPGASLDAEPFPTRLSPLLVHGFDALYSLIGFDGRTLAGQRYAAVQIQINASDLEWVFGQPPLSEGWARSLIERLKDAAAVDQNLLGQLLEVALAEGRLHTVLLGGAVNEGVAEPDSFSVTRLLQGRAAGEPGFATA